MNHDRYSDDYIRSVLAPVRTIAMVGASTNPRRPSYFAAKYLIGKGFRVIPVNPLAAGAMILDETIHGRLDDVPDPVDMVEIFRNSEAAGGIVDEALALRTLPKVIWMQLTIRNDAAAARAEAAGLRVVMNRCPKIEFARLNAELGWAGMRSGVITSRKRPVKAMAGTAFGDRTGRCQDQS